MKINITVEVSPAEAAEFLQGLSDASRESHKEGPNSLNEIQEQVSAIVTRGDGSKQEVQ